MISSALNVAASSLKSQQQAINVISNNIANVNTPGYSRQTPGLGTATSERLGEFNFGNGVQLTDIRRAIDPFLIRAQSNNGSHLAFWQTVENGLNTVESVFGGLDTPGLVSSVDAFFQAFQQLANNPQDAGQRLNVRARAQDIISQLSGMRSQLVDAQTSANAEIDQNITRANQLLDQIASLNARISIQEGSVIGPANDLRDQRDTATRSLSGLLPIQVVNGASGKLLLQTAGGDLLVQGSLSRHLARSTTGTSGFADIIIQGTNIPVQGLDQGGKIGGLIALRDGQMSSYIQQVDSIAANLAFSVNQLHTRGVGLTLPSTVTSDQAAANSVLALDDPTQNVPFASQIVSGSFTVHVYDIAGTATPPGGTVINITQGLTTLNDVATQLNGVAGITASVDTTGHLLVDAGTGTVGFGEDSSNFLAAYEINSFFHGGNAADISLSSSIAADANNIAAGAIDPATSQHPIGDNSISLGIIALQDAAISFDSTSAASLHDRGTSLSSNYGTDVATATQQRIYREGEFQSLASQRQTISGVNTDEELIAMIKFQRAYEASAKVIQSTNQMLDSLLGLIR